MFDLHISSALGYAIICSWKRTLVKQAYEINAAMQQFSVSGIRLI